MGSLGFLAVEGKVKLFLEFSCVLLSLNIIVILIATKNARKNAGKVPGPCACGHDADQHLGNNPGRPCDLCRECAVYLEAGK
jgi:hypothetical protein